MENIYSVSPNKKFHAVFTDFHEPAMGACESNFQVINDNDIIVGNFEKLKAIGINKICWTTDSKYFTLPVRSGSIFGYLTYHLDAAEFCFLKILNPYPLNIYFKEHILLITYSDEQVLLSNSHSLAGGGINALPQRLYTKPPDLIFSLSELKFHPITKLLNIDQLTKSEKEFDLKLINSGYSYFDGKLPQDTITGYNGRAFEVYQLEAFADYGDQLSKLWLEEIKRATNNNYSRWRRVSDYIGYHKRDS